MNQQDRGGLARLRHDLRTCVNQILGYSELLREDAEALQPQFVPDLARIHESGRRVLALVDGLFADGPVAPATSPPAFGEAGDGATANRAADDGDGARILVVDDNEMNRDMLSRRLTRQGFRIVLADDGPSALRLVAAESFDLVLLDWMMPGMSGLDVLAALRREHDAAQLPVIMATAKAESEDIVAALEAGANDYVTKPFDFAVVLARTRTQLAMKRSLDENRRLLQDLEIRNRFIRQTFGRYLTDEIVANLLDDRSGLELGGEKRSITILMTDLRGFSIISERMGPQLVVRILNLYFDVMTEVIMESGGTIDEFIGDAILVFFGAPGRRVDHAAAAIRCAVRMQLAMEDVNTRLVEQGLPALAMGVGIHTGDVVVGNVGSARRAKYGAVGSSVNLASRIETFTVGGQILASAAAVDAAAGEALTGRAFDVTPKGTDSSIRLFEILGVAGDPPLRLNAADPPLVPLTPHADVSVLRVYGKDVGGEEHAALVVALSRRGARLRLPFEAGPFSDLRLRTEAPPPVGDLPSGGSRRRGEIYAKVTAVEVDGVARVTFTSVESAAAAWIEGTLAAAPGVAGAATPELPSP